MQYLRLREASDCPNPEAVAKIAAHFQDMADFLEEPYPGKDWIGYYLELGAHQILIERDMGSGYFSIQHLDLGLCTQGRTRAKAMMMLDDIVTVTLEDVIADSRKNIIHTWTGNQYQADCFIEKLGGHKLTLDDWKNAYAKWLTD